MLQRMHTVFRRIKFPLIIPSTKASSNLKMTHKYPQSTSLPEQNTITPSSLQNSHPLQKVEQENELFVKASSKVVSEMKSILTEVKHVQETIDVKLQSQQHKGKQDQFVKQKAKAHIQQIERGKSHTEEADKFNKFLELGSTPILKVSAVFPLDLFPDILIVDPVKVTQISRVFFGTNQVRSISIKDIKIITVENSPFFSTLRISDNMLQPSVFVIKPLWKKEACRARDIIQGLMESTKQDIDTTKITPEEKLSDFEELGKTHE